MNGKKKKILLSVIEDFFLPLSNLKSLEKLFLHKMKDIYNLVIEPLHQQSTKISSDLEGLERWDDIPLIYFMYWFNINNFNNIFQFP